MICLIATLVLVTNVKLQGQTIVGNACMSKLQLAYKQEMAFLNNSFQAQGCWYMRYTNSSLVRDVNTGKKRTVVTKGELLASPDLRYMKTDGNEVYMDKDDVFVIDNVKKRVTRTISSTEALKRKSNAFFDLFNEENFKAYRMQNCVSVLFNNKRCTHYQIVAVDKSKATFEAIAFYIEDKTNVFWKVEATINPAINPTVESYSFIVEERTTKKDIPCLLPVHRNVISGSALVPRYNGFVYKDFKALKKQSL